MTTFYPNYDNLNDVWDIAKPGDEVVLLPGVYTVTRTLEFGPNHATLTASARPPDKVVLEGVRRTHRGSLWTAQHAERCRVEWPHAGRCKWPPPDRA